MSWLYVDIKIGCGRCLYY